MNDAYMSRLEYGLLFIVVLQVANLILLFCK